MRRSKARAGWSIKVSSTGGQNPPKYSINGTVYQSSTTFNQLAPGTYTLYVKDGNSCIATNTATIASCPGSFTSLSSSLSIKQDFYLKAAPNPVQSVATATFNSNVTGNKYEIVVCDGNGKSLFVVVGRTIHGINTAKLNMGGYANGLYFVKLVTEEGMRTLKLQKNK